MQCVKTGCTDWQPDNYDEGVTADIAEEKRIFLLKWNEFDLQDKETLEYVVTAMNMSYPLQRLFLNNVSEPPTLQAVLETWPCILQQFYMKHHFHTLTGKKKKTF